jgi:hypothetical protein
MEKKLIGSCIFGQSGGPTAVINASAYGVIRAALDAEEITKVYGAAHGIRGVLEDKLYVMDEGTCGDVDEGQRVAGLDVGGRARYYLVAYLQTLGRDDIRLVAVLILDQRDERGAVGIVLDGLNDTFYVKLLSLEINNTVFSPVAAASVTNCDATVAVTA